jgi:hypothetical protein
MLKMLFAHGSPVFRYLKGGSLDKQNRTCYTPGIGPSRAMSYPILLAPQEIRRKS